MSFSNALTSAKYHCLISWYSFQTCTGVIWCACAFQIGELVPVHHWQIISCVPVYVSSMFRTIYNICRRHFMECYFQRKTIYSNISNYEKIWCACCNFRANLTTIHQPTNSSNPGIPETSSLPKLGGTASPVPVWPKAKAMTRQPPTTKTPSNASYCATQRITQFHLSLPTQNLGVILLMDKILHQLIRSLSHYLQGFIHPNGGWEWDFFH